MSTSFAEMCEYSSRKWCSVNHAYLKPARSPAYRHLDLVQQPPVLEPPLRVRRRLRRHVARVEDPELHAGLSRARRRTAARCTRAGRTTPPSRPTPLVLMPPNGASWLRCTVLMPTLPARSRRADPHRAAGVAAEHVVVEAELGAVGDRDAFVLVVERHDDDHRAEDLLLHDAACPAGSPAISVGAT